MSKSVEELTGNRILLRGIKKSDIDDRYKLGKYDEFIYMCGGDIKQEDINVDRDHWVKWYERFFLNDCAWIIEYEGRCIDSTRLHNISKTDKSAAYAIGIFDPALYSKAIGTEATLLVLKHDFYNMQLHRIWLKVIDHNKRAIACYEKCGFKKEGVLRDSAFIEGEYHSDIIMSILADDYNLRGIEL